MRRDATRRDPIRRDARFARRGRGCAQTARATGAVPYNASSHGSVGTLQTGTARGSTQRRSVVRAALISVVVVCRSLRVDWW